MKEVITASDLMEQLITMNKENSVCQVRIPGKENRESLMIRSEWNRHLLNGGVYLH